MEQQQHVRRVCVWFGLRIVTSECRKSTGFNGMGRQPCGWLWMVMLCQRESFFQARWMEKGTWISC
eukprot:2776233-Rhodomonas_salina.1